MRLALLKLSDPMLTISYLQNFKIKCATNQIMKVWPCGWFYILRGTTKFRSCTFSVPDGYQISAEGGQTDPAFSLWELHASQVRNRRRDSEKRNWNHKLQTAWIHVFGPIFGILVETSTVFSSCLWNRTPQENFIASLNKTVKFYMMTYLSEH